MYKAIRFLLLCLVFDLLYIHELLDASATLFLSRRGRPVDSSTDVVTDKNVSFCRDCEMWSYTPTFSLIQFLVV